MNEAYLSGQNEILRLAFQTIIVGETDFYVGLGGGPIPEGREKGLTDVVEVAGSGYTRILVQRSDDVDDGWTLDEDEGILSSPTLTFTNTSSDPQDFWTDADFAFLTLSPEGVDAPAVLFTASELVETFILAGSQSQSLVVQFRLLS